MTPVPDRAKLGAEILQRAFLERAGVHEICDDRVGLEGKHRLAGGRKARRRTRPDSGGSTHRIVRIHLVDVEDVR